MSQENSFGDLIPGSGSTRQAAPVAIPLPESPGQRADRERDNAAANRDQTRTDIQARGEGRDIAKTAFQQARDLREEFTKLPQVREYQTVIRQYSSALKTQPTPTGDQALITAYAKMLDPGSVVREQEFNTVAAGDSTVGQLIARLNKELGTDQAGLLRPEVRARVRDEMLNLAKSYNQAYTQARDSYGSLAQRNGFAPADVVGPHYGEPYLDAIEQSLIEQRMNRAYVTGPDGKRVDFEVPANADDSAIRTAAAKALNDPRYEGSEVRRNYDESTLSQGMSGINEGIANTLGAPVDLTTWGMNLIPRGINTIANTNIPLIENPIAGGEWWRGKMSDLGMIRQETNNPTGQFIRRVGESVGSTLLPMGATARTGNAVAGALASGLGGGVGAATAEQAFPGNPIAEFAGETLGSGMSLAGTLANSRRLAQREIESAIPTIDDLKQQASDLYRQAEHSGAIATGQQTQDLADALRATLAAEGRVSPTGRVSEVYPKVVEGLRLADDYAGQTMTPTQLQTVRSVIADGANSAERSERRTANMLLEDFDAWANPLAPELPQARDISSRYLNAEKLETARELAAARAGQFSGSGFENALRTEYRRLDRDAIKTGGRGMTDPLIAAIENVSRGTPASNFARNVGKLAPRGVVSGVIGTGGSAALGNMVGGPFGAAVAGTGALTLGEIGRASATRMGLRNAEIAELLARNGGPIEQAPLVDADTQRAIAAVLLSQANGLSQGDSP